MMRMLVKLRYLMTIGLIPELMDLDTEKYGRTGYFIFIILFCLISAAAAYFLGSMNFAVIISKVKFKDDIRRYGSGNAGMTNMLRTYGKTAAAFTLLGDAAKAVVSVLIGSLLAGEAGAYIAGLVCVIGHSYPAYYGFKGGKGIVVTAATLLCLEPVIFLILLLLFVLIVAGTKYLSLGSIIGMMIYPVLLDSLYPVLHGSDGLPIVPAVVSMLNTILVIWLHRENIQRLLKGKENKFSLKKTDKFVKAEKEAQASGESDPIPAAEKSDTVEEKPAKSKKKRQEKK